MSEDTLAILATLTVMAIMMALVFVVGLFVSSWKDGLYAALAILSLFAAAAGLLGIIHLSAWLWGI